MFWLKENQKTILFPLDFFKMIKEIFLAFALYFLVMILNVFFQLAVTKFLFEVLSLLSLLNCMLSCLLPLSGMKG